MSEQHLTRAEQARINGRLSRGPKTPEGKARSRMNALKHGRYAKNAVVLSTEDPRALEDRVAELALRLLPTDPVEYALVRDYAAHDWNATRLRAAITAILNQRIAASLASIHALPTLAEPPGPMETTAGAIESFNAEPRGLSSLAVQEARAIRLRDNALRQLALLRKQFPLRNLPDQVIPPQPLDQAFHRGNEPKQTNRGAALLGCAPGIRPAQKDRIP